MLLYDWKYDSISFISLFLWAVYQQGDGNNSSLTGCALKVGKYTSSKV